MQHAQAQPNSARAGMRLLNEPRKPKWRPFIQVSFGVKTHESWKHFIDVAYWNVELGEDQT